MLSKEERDRIANEAVRKAELADLLYDPEGKRNWRVFVREGYAIWRTEENGGRECVAEQRIAELMLDVEQWKRRAEKHGCNVDDGDPDCG